MPLTVYTDRAFAAVAKFHELERERDIAKAVKHVRAQIMNLQEYDWKKLAKVMDEIAGGEACEGLRGGRSSKAS